MGILDNLTGNQRTDRKTGTLTTQPFRSVYNQGTIWIGENNSVWLYMVLPDFPTMFEDAPRRLEIGGQINNVLEEIGKLSRDPLGNTTIGGRAREIHLITHLWYDIPRTPDRSTPRHAEFLDDIYNFLAPNKATWIGVRLWPENESAETPTTLGNLRRTVANLAGFDLEDLSAYTTDLNRIRRILTVNSGRIPTDTEVRYMTSWYNAGREGDPTVVAFPDRLVIDGADDIEFTAVTKFNFIKFDPRTDTWLASALTHPEGAVVVSIRGQLESSATTRRRLKQTQRKIRHQIEEEEAAVAQGEVESVENVNLAAYNKQVEDYFAQSHTPVLTNTSFVFARRARHADETFNDALQDIYGIETKILTHRQIDALEETLPTSSKRATQAKESLTIPMLAYSGVRSFSELGDKDGAFPGVIIPDMVPMYISSRAASESNLGPLAVVVGVPGSGKTMLLQMLAFQYALLGEPVFFLNPKADDDLTPLARLTGGTVLNISDAEPGAFDPFRFARTPELAAEAAADFLLEVLPPTSVHDKVAVRVGLSRGAKAGARSVLEALKLGMDDAQFIKSVEGLLEASSLFRIAVGTHPREPFRASKTLTLVQFDQGLNLPDPHKSPSEYSDGERLALGAQLLITNGGMQALRGEGGVIIVDEAHRWLSNSETLNQLQKLGREGRSQSLFTILATQRLGDVDTSTLLSYAPRITVLRVEEEEEAIRSLELLGLEPTGERIRWLREETKAVRGQGDEPGRAPLGLHRDLQGRHAAFMAGPYPESLMKQFSTNPLDRDERRKAEETQRAIMRERSMMLPQGAPPPGVIGPTGSTQGQEEIMGSLERVDERAPQDFSRQVPMQERK